MTRLVRADPPRASLATFLVLVGLVVGIALFSVLTIVVWLLDGPQVELALWTGMVFLLVTVLLDVYRREYLPDELIHKKRRPKIVNRRAIR